MAVAGHCDMSIMPFETNAAVAAASTTEPNKSLFMRGILTSTESGGLLQKRHWLELEGHLRIQNSSTG